ncbi:hypothetical protein TNCV_4914241 [Trichonephila clavipes]|nr:hypothetical protein TNCV_4914241 [Trichonephila clavipes]
MRRYAGRRNGECLSSIKHVVGVRSVFLAEIARRIAVKNHTQMLPQREMANNQSVRRHLDALPEVESLGRWRKAAGTAIRAFNSGRPRGTTPADEETGGRQREKSLDTRHRRLDDRYRILPWPEDCTVVVCLHDALYDESRFSLSSDSHSHTHLERGGEAAILPLTSLKGTGMEVAVFSFGEASSLRRYGSAVPFHGRQCTMSSHSSCRTALESEDIERRRLAARTLPPVTIRELRLALQDEWAAMPQQLIDTLILSMGRRCETCLAVRGDHIPY